MEPEFVGFEFALSEAPSLQNQQTFEPITKTFEHEQLQEQRLQLKKILEQQKKEQEKTEDFPALKSEYFSTAELKSDIKHHPIEPEDEFPASPPLLQIVQPDDSLQHDELLIKPQLRAPSTAVDHSDQLPMTIIHADNFESFTNEQEAVKNTLRDVRKLSQTNPSVATFDATKIPASCMSSSRSNTDNITQESGGASYQQGSETSNSDEQPVEIIKIGPEYLSQPLRRCYNTALMKKAQLLINSKVSFECEWETCTELYTVFEDYVSHVEQHILQYTSNDHFGRDGHIVCLWRDCNTDFEDQAELIRHIYFHSVHTRLKAVGQCVQQMSKMPACQLESSGRCLLPSIPEAFRCHWYECSSVFVSAAHFYWHMANHPYYAKESKGAGGSMLHCEWAGCNRTFSKMSKLKDHLRTHSQEKTLGCPHCGAVYSTKIKFTDHLVRQLPLQKQLYECTCCMRRFATESLARDHLRHHINHYKCPHCDMTCSSQTNLDSHIKYRHSEDRPHTCQHCNKGFKFVPDLQRHLVTHTGQKVFECNFPNCNFKRKTPASLDKHIREVHMKERDVYACHLCSAERTTGYNLSRHLMQVHSFTWPSGHTRFIYRRDSEGKHRLQTVRYESLELTQGMDRTTTGSEDGSGDDPDGDCDAVTVEAATTSAKSLATDSRALEAASAPTSVAAARARRHANTSSVTLDSEGALSGRQRGTRGKRKTRDAD